MIEAPTATTSDLRFAAYLMLHNVPLAGIENAHAPRAEFVFRLWREEERRHRRNYGHAFWIRRYLSRRTFLRAAVERAKATASGRLSADELTRAPLD